MLISKETPKTLTGLLKAATLALWRGKSCEKQFYSNVAQAVAVLGEDMEVSTHQVAQLKRYFEAKGLKPATVNQKLVNLHSVLAYGRQNGWVHEVPKFTFEKIDNDNARTRVLSQEEEAQMLAWFRSNGFEHMAGFVELLILTGCRRSELLRADRLNVDGNWLRLYITKTKQGRPIPLTPRAKALADELIPFHLDLFEIHMLWNRAKQAVGLDSDASLVLHSLRHTAATRLLRKCGNIKVVKEFLGHKSLKTTERYAKLTNDDLMAAVLR
jgi:integrase